VCAGCRKAESTESNSNSSLIIPPFFTVFQSSLIRMELFLGNELRLKACVYWISNKITLTLRCYLMRQLIFFLLTHPMVRCNHHHL
jgi:hypothetical protein